MLGRKNRITLNLGRHIRLFFEVEAGSASSSESASGPYKSEREILESSEPEHLRRQLRSKDQEIARLQSIRSRSGSEAWAGGVKPENIVWIFGVARTGSTWLSGMMGDLAKHSWWNEPYVGDVFGYAYYMRAWDWMRGREEFILGDPYKKVWLNSIRSFILEGAYARFTELAEDNYLVIKEPNGSVGAPLLMEAMPESRMILLIRDPRDVVSSLLYAQKKQSWAVKQVGQSSDSLADTDPDKFVRQRANMYMASLGKAKEAYESHQGLKAVVRYENLRYETLETLKQLYSSLDIPTSDKELARVVEKHAWENIPEQQKGVDKPRRKAKPGGWREDLTPGQAQAVEQITAPILKEFYSA